MIIFSQKSYNSVLAIFIYSYISFLSIYHLSGVEVAKSITNFHAVLIIIYTFFTVLVNASNNGMRKKSLPFIVIVSLSLCMHIIINFYKTDFIDVLKFASLFLFTYVGYGLLWDKLRFSKGVIFFLAFCPLLIEILGGSKAFYSGVEFGFLPNRNTAVMYYSLLITIYLTQNNKPNGHSVLFVINAILFQKLGAMLSVFGALFFVYYNLIIKYIKSLLFIVIFFFFLFFYLGFFDRLIDVVSGLIYLFYFNSFVEVSEMPYSAIISEVGSTDLSAVFRIKHWAEIIVFFISQDLLTMLFGYGARYTIMFTSESLMPHSDILRILCEFGFIPFILFFYMYYHLYKGLICRHFKVAFLIMFFYFFTENLIDNFISMYVFHLLLGVKFNENYSSK